MLHWKLKRFLLCSLTSSQNQKPLESWVESWDLTWLDSLTWIINKTLCTHVLIMLADASSRCPPVSPACECSGAECCVPLSLFAAHALSVRSTLKLAVVMTIMIMIEWLHMPPIKTTVQVIWDKMTGSCHRGRQWDLCWIDITDIVYFFADSFDGRLGFGKCPTTMRAPM